MDYLYYFLAVLVFGLLCFFVARFTTRSKNPDLLTQARIKTARRQSAVQTKAISWRGGGKIAGPEKTVVSSPQEWVHDKTHYRTPWGWPSVDRQNGSVGVSESVRKFTHRLVNAKQVHQPGASHSGNGSIRALLEDRYGPVNRGMTEVPYQKVKAPLLRDPSEQHDQLDNLGTAESRRLRQKLQFLSAMNTVKDESGSEAKGPKKVEFRYVELKDLKQPWGW